MKSKNYLTVLIIIIAFVVSLFTYLFVRVFKEMSDNISVILDESSGNIIVYDSFNENEFKLMKNDVQIDKDSITYTIEGNVDTNKVGEYRIIYHVKYGSKTYDEEKIINVVDNEKPIITTNLENVERDFCTKKDKTKFIYNANDNYDGDLTNNIELIEENDKIILNVSDSSGNSSTKTINIKYNDKPKSTLKLVGNKKIYVPINGKYKENGVSYKDGCGTKIKESVKISGKVDTSTLGTYEIVYEIGGKTLKREVEVYDPNVSKKYKGKVIYLTFDDGPGGYTKKILDILDKYNVKVTFFVTHQFPKYESLIGEEAKRGHTVAVHTYTHNYNIYKSVDTYLKDFNKMNDLVEKYTGSRSKVFRFPGGSSNTVSFMYSKGVVTKIAKQMTKDGYVYFDWNVGSADTSATIKPSGIKRRVVNGVKYCDTCVVLMHDIKYNTYKALDSMLYELTSKGYKFGTLNENVEAVHHGISN